MLAARPCIVFCTEYPPQFETKEVIIYLSMIVFQDGAIEFSEFIRALSVTSRGNIDEKLECKLEIF